MAKEAEKVWFTCPECGHCQRHDPKSSMAICDICEAGMIADDDEEGWAEYDRLKNGG